ncbi:hypothetical protein ACIBPB_11825 [Micromonospora sp. NPDC049836]|uniref:hypothetical protein n=1 Tax=Micromonospora sp. NPDC049836 TaxID=3364274 RepID=UPI0037A05A28
MSTLVGYASLACVAAGLLAGLIALATTRDGRLALRVALDLWLAAGLLRLALPPSLDQLLSAAAIIAVRQLVGLGLSPGQGTPSTGD